MQTLRLCVFLAFIATLRAYELSQNLAEFYCIMNGNITDIRQAEASGGSRTEIDIIFQPVFAPTLSTVPVIYLQSYNEGVLVRSLVLIVKEADDGTVITTPYNFTGNTDIKQGPVDRGIIKSLTWNDLQGQGECKDTYTRVQLFVFLLNWADCREPTVNGKRETYGVISTCNDSRAIMPPGAAEKYSLTPYQFTRNGNKYQLEAAPDNYVCDCDKPSA